MLYSCIMEDKLLKGAPVADKITEDVKEYIQKNNIQTSLAIILVDERPDSLTYIRLKRKKCEELGIRTFLFTFTRDNPVQNILDLIDELNENNAVNGIIVQLPLPNTFTDEDEYKILNRILPEKDVDGFHEVNMGKLMLNKGGFIPCTAEGCYELIKHYKIDLHGKHVVIIGSSKVVGLPLSILLLHKGATVTMCNVNTRNIKDITVKADILISACGVASLIKKNWVKDNVIIIDVGINHIIDANNKERIVGDVDFHDVLDKVKYITPVPGGVGPLTVATLMKHVARI